MNQEQNQTTATEDDDLKMIAYASTQRDKELAITAAKNKIQIWKEAEDRLKDYQKEYRKRKRQAEKELKKAEAIVIQ